MTGCFHIQRGSLEQIEKLGRGVNILGYDPLRRDFERARFRARHFERDVRGSR
jgi:hypothetical protein